MRIIKQAELWEASVVPFGMNPAAQITSVKSDIRLFESALRERMGLSQKEAAAVASLGYPRSTVTVAARPRRSWMS
ncbi:hypothetical protein [Pseudomonas oryzihabitans]|uniref:hypothetical protein n=1 Tax=Pseudomonas oryzihabitans TaxID=47885 RepID=UPI003F59ECEE